MKFLYECVLKTGIPEKELLQWAETEVWDKGKSGCNFPWNPAIPDDVSSKELTKQLI